MADSNLVTTCSFHGQEYLFKMKVLHGTLEILVTDKNTGEEWQCSYDATYIENLTHKTGNFKQFDIFVAMIKAGLLRTSESVTLDLLTFEDLEMLRTRKITKSIGHANTNRRYLIVTYIVEFDKIRYPLPLEYCGMPDPVILQTTIRRLELELAKTKEDLALKQNNGESKRVYYLQKKLDELNVENSQLKKEIRQLSCPTDKKTKPNVLTLQRAVCNLEKSVVKERKSHHDLVEQLKNDNAKLLRQLEQVRCSEKSLKIKLNQALSRPNSRHTIIGDHPSRYPERGVFSNHSLRSTYRRTSRNRTPSPPSLFLDISGEGVKKSANIKYDALKSSRPKVRSRSSSISTKYRDIEEIQHKASIRSLSPSPVRDHSHCLDKTKYTSSSRGSSRASSHASRASRNDKSSVRRSRSRKNVDYQMLEEKIEDLQRLLRNNYLPK